MLHPVRVRKSPPRAQGAPLLAMCAGACLVAFGIDAAGAAAQSAPPAWNTAAPATAEPATAEPAPAEPATSAPESSAAAAPATDSAPLAQPGPSSPPSQVEAQSLTPNDAARLSPPPAPGSAGSGGYGAPVAEPSREEDSSEEKRDPMGWFGVSVKVGVSNVNAGNIDNPTYNRTLAQYAAMVPEEQLLGTGLIGNGACTPIDEKCRTPSRTGFHLAATLHFGGDGAGWDIEPYISTPSGVVAVGMYTGPKFDIHIVDPFYLGFGFGFKAAYVAADGWQHGADLFGRIPVHATYYVTPDFALTLEGSFGAGISLFVSEPINITDPRNGRRLASAPKIGIGAARSWDLTVGVRFP